MFDRQIGDLFGEESALHDDGIGARFLDSREGRINLVRPAEHHHRVNLHTRGAPRKPNLIDERF